jgi:uncharacterized delta-60 repeat protein
MRDAFWEKFWNYLEVVQKAPISPFVGSFVVNFVDRISSFIGVSTKFATKGTGLLGFGTGSMKPPYSLSIFAICLATLAVGPVARGQWVAFNDHDSGPGTTPNATLYNNLGAESGLSGFLKNILWGTNLPVTLTISTNAGASIFHVEAVSASPAPGTRLANTFDGFVDFSTDHNVILDNNFGQSVTYTFSGLDPSKKYVLQGGAVRGNPNYTTRYSLFQLDGAESFSRAHSAGCLTTVQVPSLLSNQVAIATGYNSSPETGDMFDWEGIVPGSDGIISVFCRSYNGPLPGGGTAFRAGYALTAIKLAEVVEGPVSIVVQPTNQVVNLGDSPTFRVEAEGYPLHYQWFRDGAALPGETDAVLTLPAVGLSDQGSRVSVVVSNDYNTVISDEASLIVRLPPIEIMPFSQLWRYESSGTDLGTAWKEVGFDDSSWPSGPGPLGFETAALPVPLATTFPSNNKLTYYFRTTFEFPDDPTQFSLTLTNMIDDGAVFYLNGTEILRVRMPTGPIGFNTPSVAPAVGDAALETVNVITEAVQPGSNVLAVEVHQINSTSSDMVFGTSLTAPYLVSHILAINRQPADLTVEIGETALFSVEASGQDLEYQWFKDAMLLPGVTNASLVIPSVTTDDAGFYSVTVSDQNRTVTSRQALLTVMPREPLVITKQPVDITVTQGMGFTLSGKVQGGSIGYFQWQKNGKLIPGATNFDLNVSFAMIQDSGIYSFAVGNNLESLASSNAVVVVTPASDPIPAFSSLWRYEVSGTDLAEEWKEPDYVDFGWPAGPGPFGFESDPLPEPLRTEIPNNQGWTYYFRTAFVFEMDPHDYEVTFTNLIDDGAVFYLNGRELFRVGMNEGPVDFMTAAGRAVGNAVFETVTIPGWQFVQGINYLAVEVHQTALTSTDLVFGTHLAPEFYPPSQLAITNEPQDVVILEGQDAVLTVGVSGHGAHYQWYKDGSPLAGATEPTLVLSNLVESDSGVVTVTASNSVNIVESREAILTVKKHQGPTMVTPPQDQTVFVGTPAQFTVEVEGDPPLFFQWTKDGQPLPGETNQTLTVSGKFLSDAGSYSVSVSNALDRIESQAALLTVLEVPRGPAGSLDTNFNAEVGNIVRTIVALPDGRCYVSGFFTSFNDQPQSLLARLNSDGSLDESFRPDLEGRDIYAVTPLSNGSILVGGQISLVGGQARSGLARLNPDGSLDPSFNAGELFSGGIDFNIRQIVVQPDERIIVAGQFTAPWNRIARLHTDGSLDTTFNPGTGADDVIRALALQPDGRILIGGLFRHYDGHEQGHLARLWPDGSLDTEFLAGTNAPDDAVYFLALDRDKILLGGSFTAVNRTAISGVARVFMDDTGDLDDRFHPPGGVRGGPVYSISQQRFGHLVIGGAFTNVNGVTLPRVARLNPDGTLDPTFRPGAGPNGTVLTTEVLPSGDVMIGGLFSSYNSIPRLQIARLVGDSSPYLKLRYQGGAEALLSWPTNGAEGYLVQGRTLVDLGDWIKEPGVPTAVEGWNTLSIQVTNQSRFFRLWPDVEP